MLDLTILKDDHKKQISELQNQLKIQADKHAELAETVNTTQLLS